MSLHSFILRNNDSGAILLAPLSRSTLAMMTSYL